MINWSAYKKKTKKTQSILKIFLVTSPIIGIHKTLIILSIFHLKHLGTSLESFQSPSLKKLLFNCQSLWTTCSTEKQHHRLINVPGKESGCVYVCMCLSPAVDSCAPSIDYFLSSLTK